MLEAFLSQATGGQEQASIMGAQEPLASKGMLITRLLLNMLRHAHQRQAFAIKRNGIKARRVADEVDSYNMDMLGIH
jgi:hypothetical protein